MKTLLANILVVSNNIGTIPTVSKKNALDGCLGIGKEGPF
jgi:hypothetical protein